MGKYDVPRRRADSLRAELHCDAHVPVRFARHGKTLTTPHRSFGIPEDPFGCAFVKAHEESSGGLPAKIAERDAALVERDHKGRLCIVVYQHSLPGYRMRETFDETKQPMTGGLSLHLLPWPPSWFSDRRREMARKRRERMKDPNYKPKPYKARKRNPHLGVHRISSVFKKN